MCGIVGIVGKSSVNQSIYDALTVLQHRGQDAAGIATWHDGKLLMRKSNGLVRDVFRHQHMLRLQGNVGIGHVRYPTAGCSSSSEAQPFYTNSPFGISLAHNGNLTNAESLKQLIELEDMRHLNTGSDSEILLNVFAHELQESANRDLNADDIFTAVTGVHRRCVGGYAIISMINGYGIVGFRDPHGIRPLVLGKRETNAGVEYMIASESVALDAIGFKLERDVAPGEAVFVDLEGNLHTKSCSENSQLNPCIFEYVYFARPDSIMDNVSVYKSRLRMGEKLAEKINRESQGKNIDVVIPIPDTSRTSALQLANKLGVKYREGFIKNRYIGRTFIMPGQQIRRRSVKQKLNAIDLEFQGKNVLLVDDSIVRGTTSQQIIQMARDAGANKVFFASAAPPVRFPNVYGIDMPVASELVAYQREVGEIEREIGADWLIYQDLEDLEDTVRRGNPDIKTFDSSCFSGQYVTGDITSEYLDQLSKRRSDEAKDKRDKLRAVSLQETG
ncbi:MAG: amidophosphoribosyltransferase [Gammaproteobacteria bacterium]